MKRTIYFLGFMFITTVCYAQLTLQECRTRAYNNYPLIKQYKLVEQSRNFTVENASKGYLPQISLSGKATYQSEVTKIPISIPGYDIKEMAKDQYNIMVEILQNVYDGGAIASQKRTAEAEADVNKEQLNVTMYDINSRIEQFFFGILLLDEQIKQNKLLQNDLELSMKSISGMMKSGIANQTDVDAIRVEQINAEQQETSLNTSRRAYLAMLGIFIGENLNENTTFIKPSDEMPVSLKNNRPELRLYDAQSSLLDTKLSSIDTRLRPKLGLFADGAYGRPGLNMLKNEFTPYYIFGVRLSWNLGSLYTRKNDKRLIEVSRQQIENNRETFLFNSKLQTTNETEAIQDLKQKLKTDNEIVTLRTNIRCKAESKVENGTLTVNEMLRQINAESEAKQSRALHEIQLIQEIYKLKNLLNKE